MTPGDYTHADLLAVVQALDECDAEVTDWEARFLESALEARHYTRKQKGIILKMKSRYLD